MAGTKEGGISVALRQCRNLHSPRSEKFSCLVQVEHCGSIIGSCNKPDWGKDKIIDVDLEVKVQCTASDPQSLVNVTTNPLIVSFLEVLPKDKKSKEEKTSVLGQASVDLLPVLLGEYSSQLTVTLHSSESGSPGGDEMIVRPDVDVEITIDHPLLKPDKLAQSNVLSLRVRSLHSLPESWQPGTFPFTFALAIPLPSATPTTDDNPSPRGITVPQGVLKLSPDKDPTAVSAFWKWPNSHVITSKASQVPECEIKPRPLEDETGELNTKQDIKFRTTSECDRPRVTWNIQHRTWMNSSSTHSLLSRLSVCPVWPIEIGRFSIPSTGGKSKAKEEEPVLSYLGVAYVNLASLLYPGATHVCGAYPLHPFSEAEILDKTEHHHSSILLASSQSSGQSTTTKKPPKQALSSTKLQTPSAILTGGDGEGVAEGAESKSEAQAYVDAKTYVYLEIELHRPLIPKRPASVLTERISEYIPCRPAVPRQVGGVERAMMDYQQQTAKIANVLLQEFRELYGEDLKEGRMGGSQAAVNDRRHKLLFHLNSSGKYHAFKEELKQSVVKIVREKYLNEAKAGDRDQLQSFLSQLYVFLVDEMHSGLNKVLSLEDAHPAPPSMLNSDLLKHFAFEAEEEGNFELAHRYYKERISRQDHIAENWYDYGVFCLLTSDMDRSEQCFKEAVALVQTMVPALLLYGMVCCLDERFTEAEQFFEMATTSDPTNVIAWTMRGLYYELAGNGIYQDMCFQEATKLNRGQSAQTFITTKLAKSSHSPTTQTIGKTIASQSKASVTSRQAGSLKQPSVSSINGRGQLVGGGAGEVSMPQVLLESTKSVSSNDEEGSVKNKTSLEQQDRKPVVSQTLSTIATEGGEQRTLVESKSTFNERDSVVVQEEQATGDGLTSTTAQDQDVPSTQPPLPHPSATNKLASVSGASIKSGHSSNNSQMASTVLEEKQPASVFLQTAAYLLDVHALKFAEMALAHELTSPKGGPSPQFHVAEARLYMHREQYDKAASCLKKAITMDYQDSNAWALLGHTHFLIEDYVNAKDSYERTVNYVTPCAHLHTVYIRLAQIYLNEKQYEKSKEVYLRACRKSPSAVTWRGVGVSCYHLGDLNQAEDALCEANILNNQDPVVWAYLTLVCLKTARPVEAEQALKFALKVGLNDPILMSEISKCSHTTTGRT